MGRLANAASPLFFVREIFRNIITEAEAQSLACVQRLDFDHPIVSRLVAAIKIAASDAAISDKSYARVERNSDGHDWHADTGDSDHMTWCAYSGSVLLTNDFSGGDFEFFCGTRYRHYLDLLTYSSDQWHRVTPHTDGERYVLLIFLGRENGE